MERGRNKEKTEKERDRGADTDRQGYLIIYRILKRNRDKNAQLMKNLAMTGRQEKTGIHRLNIRVEGVQEDKEEQNAKDRAHKSNVRVIRNFFWMRLIKIGKLQENGNWA